MYDTNQSNQIWWELVRPEYRSLARKIFDQDWTWTTSLTEKGIEPRLIEEYQLFLLCKIVARDFQKAKGSDRLFLSPPSIAIDEVWHQHILRPSNYLKFCWTLLRDESVDTIDLSWIERFIIDHTPESADDKEEEKEMRRENTRQHMQFLCPGWLTKKRGKEPENEVPIEEEMQKKRPKYSDMISLVVKTLNDGEVLHLQMPADGCIQDVADKMKEIKGYTLVDQRFFVGSIKKRVMGTFSKENICDGSELLLELPTVITVRDSDGGGAITNFRIHLSRSADPLMNAAAEILKSRISELRFMVAGIRIFDHEILADWFDYAGNYENRIDVIHAQSGC